MSHGWIDSPLRAQSSNHHPCPAEEVVTHSVPGGMSTRGPALSACQRRPQQHGNATQALEASHLLPSHPFGNVPEVYRCRDDQGVLQTPLHKPLCPAHITNTCDIWCECP